MWRCSAWLARPPVAVKEQLAPISVQLAKAELARLTALYVRSARPHFFFLFFFFFFFFLV